MSTNQLDQKKRFFLAILWSTLTILICYISLYLGLTFLQPGSTTDLIIGNVYTFTPGLMVLLFIFFFKTEKFSLYQFRYPGIKWIAFGGIYTIIVLFLTILTGFLVGGFEIDTTYNPFNGDLQGFSTSVQVLDILLFFVIVGFLLIFSPGGFVRIIGEEFGWRGYLFPELLKIHPKITLVGSTILVGFVWFVFHIPYFSVLAPVDPDKIIFLLLGSFGVFFGANWAMTWAYLKTRNLWPALTLHYTWNLAAPVFTGNIYSKSLGWLNPSFENLWLVNGEGLIGGMFHFLIGLIFLYLIFRDRIELLIGYNSLKEPEIELVKLPSRIKINSYIKK
jgi:membrane protease YdiL (CAAX protease family)